MGVIDIFLSLIFVAYDPCGRQMSRDSFLSPMWGTIYIKVKSLAIMSLISFSVSVLLLSKFTGLQRKVHTSYRPYLIIAHQLLMILVFRTYYLFKFRLGWFVYWEASRPP